ncbi:MAG: SoxY-related AACIE arm protein [Rhodospirillales bacterium]|nr:SoxY-related AACIE arm protein [Rhodospirillales bacterium]
MALMASGPRTGNATRRAFLLLAGAGGAAMPLVRLAAAGEVPSRPVAGGLVSPVANPAATQAAIAKVTGGARITPGRVKLELPPIVENGNSVHCTVTVDSPMTPTNYVKSIHVFTERNPQPNVIGVRLGPRAGRARFAARIRLADTQKVMAIAEMSDGSFWSDRVEIVVTGGACLEDT